MTALTRRLDGIEDRLQEKFNAAWDPLLKHLTTEELRVIVDHLADDDPPPGLQRILCRLWDLASPTARMWLFDRNPCDDISETEAKNER